MGTKTLQLSSRMLVKLLPACTTLFWKILLVEKNLLSTSMYLVDQERSMALSNQLKSLMTLSHLLGTHQKITVELISLTTLLNEKKLKLRTSGTLLTPTVTEIS